MFLLRAVLNILVRNASPRGPMCFRCLIFSLSGHCELLFLLCFMSTQFAQGLPDRCDSPTACRLCRLEPYRHESSALSNSSVK